jgi:hypothetical protein
VALAFLFVGLLFVLSVGFVVFFGPPYLPTLRKNMDAALDLLDLKPGQTMLELGSGDGRVLVAAAQRGIKVVGIELSPVLVVVSWLRTRRYRKQVRIIWGSYFSVQWPPADGIFTFMIPRQMPRLHRHIEQWRTKPLRVVSFAFVIPGRRVLAEHKGVFLYEYK